MGDKRQDLLHTVAAVAKDVMVPIETPPAAAAAEPDAGGDDKQEQEQGQDEDEEGGAGEPQMRRVRSIEALELAPLGSDQAYLLPKGSGVTYKPVVARRGTLLLLPPPLCGAEPA